MKIYDLNEYSLYTVGDIHGEFNKLFNNIKNLLKRRHRNGNKLEKAVYIICGDCGIGFNKEKYYEDLFTPFNKILEELDAYLFFVRGNHDNKSWFDGEMIDYSRIKAIPDYSVVITSNYTTLCVGGAISVDRTWRTEYENRVNRFKHEGSKKRLYFEDEPFLFEKDKIDEIVSNNIKVDSIITHTAPKEIFNINNKRFSNDRWIEKDANLKDDLFHEEKELTSFLHYMLDKFSVLLWCHGHFHYNFNTYKLIDNNVIFCKSISNECMPINMDSLKAEILQQKGEKKEIEKDKYVFKIEDAFCDFNYFTVDDGPDIPNAERIGQDEIVRNEDIIRHVDDELFAPVADAVRNLADEIVRDNRNRDMLDNDADFYDEENAELMPQL